MSYETYDLIVIGAGSGVHNHRLIDGREARTFLVAVKNAIEDPIRLLIDL